MRVSVVFYRYFYRWKRTRLEQYNPNASSDLTRGTWEGLTRLRVRVKVLS